MTVPLSAPPMQLLSAVPTVPAVSPTPPPPATLPVPAAPPASPGASAHPVAASPARLGATARARPAGTTSRRGRTYREVAAWQRAVELCVACHELARRMPAAEADGLGRSICEAAGTLAANVAQGHERLLRADYVQHLSIARGTLQRLETLLEVAWRLRYVDAAEAAGLDRRCASVGRHLSRLIRSVYGIGRAERGPGATAARD